MRIAVVGHVEWVEFARVERVPRAGEIVHVQDRWEEAAGGGAVAAVQLAKLGAETTLFTSLGDDPLAGRARRQLASQHVRARVQVVRDETRRAFTFVDADGERTITVLGNKLVPQGPLELGDFDAVYFVSGHVSALRSARAAPLLVATARELATLREGCVELDALVGSGEDTAERYRPGELEPRPRLVVTTAGAEGGTLEPGGRYMAIEPPGRIVDTYGCGDCFAAGLTFGLAEGLDPAAAAELGARCGAAVLCGRGAYSSQLTV